MMLCGHKTKDVAGGSQQVEGEVLSSWFWTPGGDLMTNMWGSCLKDSTKSVLS